MSRSIPVQRVSGHAQRCRTKLQLCRIGSRDTAGMLDWDDLRFFLELCRAGSRARAAGRLHVDETTVARRLQRLERELGKILVERAAGRIVLTDAGEMVLASAAQMEEPALDVQRRSADTQLSGRVRIAAPEILGQHFVLRALLGVRTRYPRIDLELVTALSRIDIRRREADLAVRTVRPTEPALAVRRVAKLAVAPYMRRGDRAPSEGLAFVEGMKLPLRSVEDRGSLPIALRTNAMPVMAEAVRLGWGAADLPCFVADTLPGLRRAFPDEPPQLLDIWLVVHTHSRNTPRIRAVLDELVRAFAREAEVLSAGAARARRSRRR
jgi:DNA-binding transcriptional LysR family regulator